MSEFADVTVILPTYNRAHFIAESLESLLGQTLPPRQLIVIDDGSTDDPTAVLAQFGERIEYLRQDNAGKATALNTAMPHATGSAIWIFDDDDIAVPDALEKLTGALAATPAAGFAFGDYDNFTVDDAGIKHFTAPGRAVFDLDDLHSALLERCFIFQPSLLVRRHAYLEAGPFDVTFARAQDYEMLSRLSRRLPGAYVPQVVFHQRQHLTARGTAANPIAANEVWERQKTFDARVLQKSYAAGALTDYLPRSEREGVDTPQHRVRGLLRRGAVMARKRLWHESIADIDAAADLAACHGIEQIAPADEALLGRVFDEFGYARDELGRANPLLRHVAALPNGKFRSALLAALLWPVFRYVLLAGRRGKIAEAVNYLMLYKSFGDINAVRHNVARLSAKANISVSRSAGVSGP